MNTEKWLNKNAHSLEGKRVAISGATGGIGQELCRYFAGLRAEILMLDRNTERSLAFAKKLKEEFPCVKTSHIRLDLSNVDNVRAVADHLLNVPPDYLILNAGAYHIPRFDCALGYNNVFQINYISPYFLARRLISAIKNKGGKIVAVGSIAHSYSHIDTTDIDFKSRKKSSLVYGNAKRHLMYALSALDDGAIRIAHPGITLTNITAHYPKLVFALIKHPMKLIFMKPKIACLSIISAMFCEMSPGEWCGPRFFDIWGSPKKKSLKKLSDKESRDIVNTAEEIYKGMLN